MSAGWSSTASAIRLIPMFDPSANDTGGLRRRAVSGPVISREATEGQLVGEPRQVVSVLEHQVDRSVP